MAAPVFLDDATVAAHLPWAPLIQEVEAALGDFSRQDGSVWQPARAHFTMPHHNGWFGCMPGYIKRSDALATKLVTSYPGNSSLPKIQSTVLLHCATDGRLLAVMSGERITACRTAAASVAATRHLAPRRGVLAILGSGVQAESHAEAFLADGSGLKEIRISARNEVKGTELVARLSKSHPEVKISYYESFQSCVDGADVITTATASPDTILFDDWIPKEGVHINVVGGRVPNKGEPERALLRRATVYSDSRASAASEFGAEAVPIYGEIGEAINGSLPAREHTVSVFVSFGVAVEDVVAARIVWDSYSAGQGAK